MERVDRILKAESNILDPAQPKPLTFEDKIELHDVSFRYEEDEAWVYRDFSLSAGRGEMIALMGRTGAGKTTLLRLLLGLITPTEGRITLQTPQAIYSVNEATRGNFVYIPQGGR